MRKGLGVVVAAALHEAMVTDRLRIDEVLVALDDSELEAVSMSRWPLPALARVVDALWDAVFADLFGDDARPASNELSLCGPDLADLERVPPTRAAGVLAAGAQLLLAARAPEADSVVAAHAEITKSLPTAPSRPTRGSDPVDASRAAGGGPTSWKIVMWMKPEEARLVADAYRRRRGGKARTANDVLIEAVWHPEGDPDAERFRANVCLLRHRSGERQPRWFWIREEEARAVLAAYEQQSDVEFEHVAHGQGGRAVYHPDGTALAEKYRANTMLARYR